MKCHHAVYLWKGMDTKAKLRKILPAPWDIHSFVDFDKAKIHGKGLKAHAICAVPKDVDTPCDELLQSLDEAIWRAKDPDDGEAGHVGETARTYVKGSSKRRGS